MIYIYHNMSVFVLTGSFCYRPDAIEIKPLKELLC